MKVTLDLTALREAGHIDQAEFDKLAALGAKSTGSLAFNILIGFGVVAVSGAALALVPHPVMAAVARPVDVRRRHGHALFRQPAVAGARQHLPARRHADAVGRAGAADAGLDARIRAGDADARCDCRAHPQRADGRLRRACVRLGARRALGLFPCDLHAAHRRTDADDRRVQRRRAGALPALPLRAAAAVARGDHRRAHRDHPGQFRLLDRLAVGREAGAFRRRPSPSACPPPSSASAGRWR